MGARSRKLLVVVSALLSCAISLGGPAHAGPASAGPVSFEHGVASGDVTPVSAVLWTRVDQEARLSLELARDSAFSPPLVRRTATASSSKDFTVEEAVAPLEPDSTYYYRFRAQGAGASVSDVGRFRTAPRPDQSKDVRFTFTGDTDGTRVNGSPAFNSFETLVAARNEGARNEGADFFIYLGDTIYPDSIKRSSGPASTLAEYRETYKVNRGYPNLRNLLSSTSTYAIWDDHEVRDGYAGQTVDPALYATGRKAFLEYFPLLDGILPRDPICAGSPLFRLFPWGAGADLMILDTHSCQSALVGGDPTRQPCLNDSLPTLPPTLRPQFGLPASPPPGCLDAINDRSRTLLGPTQKAAFKAALLASKARFKFVVTPMNIQQLYFLPYDRWEGYAAERTEILSFIRSNGIKNVVFLTTDTHANIINEVFIDHFADPAPIAHEFVTGPVAHFTIKELILGQPGLGAPALGAVTSLLGLLGVDCYDLDAYSYAEVTVNAGAGTATVNLKDRTGAILTNKGSGALPTCTKSIGP